MNFPISSHTRRLLSPYPKLLLPALLALLLALGSWAISRGDTHNGAVPIEELVISRLESGQTATWEFYVEDLAGEPDNFLYLPVVLSSSAGTAQGPTHKVTIMVAPAADANIQLTVQDGNGAVIVEDYDQAPAGEVETIVDLALTPGATYQLLISADPAQATDYALMVLDEESLGFHFQGTLASGVIESGATPLDTDDYWFFSAAAGETLTMQITPLDEMDAYVELYGPDAQLLETIDDGFGGDAELLEDYPLTESGMYGIRVGEFDFEPMTYEIVILIE
jgi:hypothetical protein